VKVKMTAGAVIRRRPASRIDQLLELVRPEPARRSPRDAAKMLARDIAEAVKNRRAAELKQTIHA
jgi:hypothetical protein